MIWTWTAPFALLWLVGVYLGAGLSLSALPQLQPPPPPTVSEPEETQQQSLEPQRQTRSAVRAHLDCPEYGFDANLIRDGVRRIRDLHDFSTYEDITFVHTLLSYKLAETEVCGVIGAEPIKEMEAGYTWDWESVQIAVAALSEGLGIQHPILSLDFDRCPPRSLACAIREDGNTTLVFEDPDIPLILLLHEYAHHADWEITGRWLGHGHTRSWFALMAWQVWAAGLFEEDVHCPWLLAADLGDVVCD